PLRVADAVLNEHIAGPYDAFIELTSEESGAGKQFVADARTLLANVDRDRAADVLAKLDANRDDIDSYYGNLIAAVDDALFESQDEADIVALEQLMQSAESAQSASRVFQDPDLLHRIEDIQQALMDSGFVGKTNALPDVVKIVNRELRSGDVADYRIPDSVPGVAQTLLQYQSSHRPQDLWHMVTPDFSSTAIWLQLKSGDNQDMTRVIDVLDSYLETNPLPDNIDVQWAGKSFINVVWQDAMVKGMLASLLGAFVVVFLMMALLFRSLRIGLLAMVPLSVTILGVYGAIGWRGKDYDMPIAVLSSLTLGLSIDFAIHFISRMRSLLAESNSFSVAAAEVFEEPARAIARNAIVIAIGFTPLFFAPLVPYITVGAFMAAIMFLSAITTLLLLPAMLAWAGSWFLPPTETRKPADTQHTQEALT
ncbi:MAG: efflux RND transporter permease subunit, partial [Woeseiaceae bacterium]